MGKAFRVTCFGESHGSAIGVVIDGCPANLEIDKSSIQNELNRRRPGQSDITTARNEADKMEIISGVYKGKSTGAPICILIQNKDQKPSDYDQLKKAYRPSHADYSYDAKYGSRDHRGGGRSSARITASWVAAGAIAKSILKRQSIEINAGVSAVGEIEMVQDIQSIDFSQTENNIVRCPDPVLAERMVELISRIKEEGDTIGGCIVCRIDNCPPGIGEPVFDKLQSDLAKAMLTINAVKAFEYGSGFNASRMKGSEHNDLWLKEGDTLKTSSNNSGGIQGGISNGMPIYFKLAFKPVSSLMQDQDSVDAEGNKIVLKGKGRHDPCVVPRAVPIVEAMAAIVMCDHVLRNRLSRI